MTKPFTFYWPPSNGNTEAVASIVPAGSPSIITLNSNNADGSYSFPDGMMRSLSITAHAGSSFSAPIHITGIGCTVEDTGNNLVPTSLMYELLPTETLGIPAEGDTVYTSNVYRTILRIEVSGDPVGVSAGYGDRGYTPFYSADYNKSPVFDCSMFGSLYDRVTMQWGSLGSPCGLDMTDLVDVIPDVFPADPISAAWIPLNLFNDLSTPYALLWGSVRNNNVENVGESAYFTFTQLG